MTSFIGLIPRPKMYSTTTQDGADHVQCIYRDNDFGDALVEHYWKQHQKK